MDVVIIIIGVFLLVIGLVGCIVPALPGPPISFSALLLLHFCSSIKIPSETLWLLAAIVSIITFLDYWLQVYGVKKFGGGKKAVNGTILGLVLALLLSFPLAPLALFLIILGPFIGALIGAKMEAKEDTLRALKIATGALVGFLGGTVLKFAASIYIFYYFLKRVFHSFSEELNFPEYLNLFSS